MMMYWVLEGLGGHLMVIDIEVISEYNLDQS